MSKIKQFVCECFGEDADLEEMGRKADYGRRKNS